MGRVVAVFFLFFCFQVVAYPSQTEIYQLIELLNDFKSEPVDQLVEGFKQCSTKKECDKLFNSIIKETVGKDAVSHLQIQYAKAINSFGSQNQAIELLNNVSSRLNDASKLVQIEYYHAMGTILVSSENPLIAATNYRKGLRIAKQINDDNSQLKCLTSIGLTFSAQLLLDSAFYYYNEALKFEKSGSIRNNLYLKLNLAWTASMAGDLEKAKLIFIQSIDYFKVVSDGSAEIRTYGNIADIYSQQDSLQLAEKFYKIGLTKAETLGYKLDVFRFERAIGEVFSKQRKFEEALLHFKRSDSIRESFNHEEVTARSIAIEKKFQEKIAVQKRAMVKQQLDYERKRTIFLMILVSLVLVLAVFFAYHLVVLKRKNLALLSQILEKDKKEDIQRNTSISSYPEILEMIQSLEIYIIEKENYKNDHLTIDKVAKKLRTNRTYLSESINTHYNMNFSRWLNEIRIKESRKLLSSEKYDKYSIEGIANMVGFSSISSFNSNFKMITGITPSFFRKNRLIN